MADPRDDRVSAAYRELPGEGPPASLDAAIQAAARRAVGARPGGARRWQVPVSIAAVLALAIGVSLHVEREKPVVVDGTPVSSGSAEYPVPQAPPEKEDRAVAAPAPAQAPATPAPALGKSQKPAANEAAPSAPAPAAPLPDTKRFAPEPARAEPAPVAPAESRIAPMQAAPAPASAPPSAAAGATVSTEALRAAPQAAKRAKAELAREQTLQEKAMADAMETPQRRLERIADLRAKGLHDEADRQLAEFRRAYPDYRIPEEWLRRVQRQ